MSDSSAAARRVLVTGGSGFVGRYVVRELIARGFHPVCAVRDLKKLRNVVEGARPASYSAVPVSLNDWEGLARAAGGAVAVIHLVGIIIEKRWRGQSFERVHVNTTRAAVEAARSAGVPQFIHVSALGTRPDAVSNYHRTKWDAENLVRASGLAWTILRPSLIHGPQGEFMQLMKNFVAGPVPPVIPYFGSGQRRIQPVSVRDVAFCAVDAIGKESMAGRMFELGGPRAYTWVELYETCRRLIPGASKLKPKVSVPLPIAKLIGQSGDVLDFCTGLRWLIPFNLAQVQMSQEDNTCDTRPVEQAFGIQMRSFEEELSLYGAQIA